MRKVLSISTTEAMEKKAKRNAKKNGFSNVSQYVNYLFSMNDDMISEEELLECSKRAREDYKKGKIIRAKSIADLVKNADKYRAQLNDN
ncbi:MAG TPA: hypothetical protein PLD14_00305 [Candidatus Pacearchaeota archaeon]|nr:hypothetical protein [Candidatus Pacearchaeota archaeon]HPR79656.1 hypothetical protein [Candidatus Pacearchaeota archaeon]